MNRFLQFLLCITIVWPLADARKSVAAPNAVELPSGTPSGIAATKLPLPGEEAPSLASMLLDLTYRYTGRGYHDEQIRYRLFVPDTSDPTKEFPLIVWLHGFGEAGNDNVHQLRYFETIIFQKPWDRKRFPFFVLAVHCPRGNRNWTTDSPDADDMANVALAILNKTTRDYPVDESRISVAGVSSGGSGCWELASRAPDRFSAVAPMSSSGADDMEIKQLTHMSIWAFHCTDDAKAAVEPDRRTVVAINAAGGRAALTEIDSGGHDSWSAAFRDYDLLDWLLYQRRGEKSDWPPGTMPLSHRWAHFRTGLVSVAADVNPLNRRPWQVAIQIGIPMLLLFGLYSAIKQRRRRRRENAAADSSPKRPAAAL